MSTAAPSAVSRRTLDGRYAPSTLRAAWWTIGALRRCRRALRRDGLAARVDPPPRLGRGATRGVYAVLRRRPTTCLERALVLQRWLAAQGERHEVVVGVTRENGEVLAHAWLEMEAEERRLAAPGSFQELHRLPPP